MNKRKKLIIFIAVTLVAIIMLSLLYYSLRATLIDYFVDNGQEQREKVTAASSDQAQIMVDLANKQLAKQQEDTEVRVGEEKNQSLFVESDANKATVKKPVDTVLTEKANDVPSSIPSSDVDSKTSDKKTNQVQNGFVVVDCDKGGVIACPHHEVQTGTTPLYYQKDKSNFLVGRCLDVSIDVKTFCP